MVLCFKFVVRRESCPLFSDERERVMVSFKFADSQCWVHCLMWLWEWGLSFGTFCSFNCFNPFRFLLAFGYMLASLKNE